MTNQTFIPLDIPSLHRAYADESLTPREVVNYIAKRSSDYQSHNIWINELSIDQLEPYLKALDGKSPSGLPLYGVPFAIKDNIDLAGVDTTAGCEAFRYTPAENALLLAV